DNTTDQGVLTAPFDGNKAKLYRYWDNAWNDASAIWLNPAGNPPATQREPLTITEESRPDVYTVASHGYAFNSSTFYDGFGRPIQTRDIYAEVAGQSLRREIITTTAYHARGGVACQTVPYDVAFYSDRGLVWPDSPYVATPCDDATLDQTLTTYSDRGKVDTVTAPNGLATDYNFYVYDTFTVGNYTKTTIEQVIDANNHVVNRLFNARGQLIQVREYTGANPWPDYAQTTYTYDLLGNLVTVVDGLNNTTNLYYDVLGRKIEMDDPDMGEWKYSYDAAGNLTRQEANPGMADEKIVCFTYDVLNRMKVKYTDEDPSAGCPTPPVAGNTHLATYVYDQATNGLGQPYTVSWGPSPTQNFDKFYYDTRGRMYLQERRIDNRLYTMQTTSFDALDRPLAVSYPNGESVTIGYDHEGENSLSAGSDSLVTNLTYNGRGQMAQLSRGNTTNLLYVYYAMTANPGTGNNNGRLNKIQYGGINDALADYTYTYDKVGNVLSLMSSEKPAGQSTQTETQTFSYDELNRLDTANGAGNATLGIPVYSHDYDYDKVGNIDLVSKDGLVTDYSYTPAQYVTHSQPHAVKSLTGLTGTFGYDRHGNMTTRPDSAGTYSQLFDALNRLVEVTRAGWNVTTTFAYNDGEQRVRSRVETAGSSQYTTYYPFPTYEEQVEATWQYVEGKGWDWVTTGVVIRRSVYSLAGQAIASRVSGDPLSGNNGLFYFQADQLGSTSSLSTTGGALVAGSTARYLPFGGFRGTPPAQTITDRGFTGHKHNNLGTTSVGLIYMGARFFVPSIGRFASADTIVPNPANPQTLNRYSYVLNSPLRYNDPTGHSCDAPVDQPEATSCQLNQSLIYTLSGGLFKLILEGWTGAETRLIRKAVEALISGLGGDLNLLSALLGGQQIGIRRDTYSDGLMAWSPRKDSIFVGNESFARSQVTTNWEFAHEVAHAIERTFASGEEFMDWTDGSIEVVGTEGGFIRRQYFPGDLTDGYEEDAKQWAVGSGRDPSEDWADTFAYFTVGQGHYSEYLPGSTPDTANRGPGMIPGSNGPGARRENYYNRVLRRAAFSVDPTPDRGY
ncbi:MAG: hypothetical protein L0332_09760, partial [Chloroflexi bacterium]|nr:hypothetical protein [Chloroflexota bacterium]MCI0646311.1 hypothetical protein [Chloroflexota bacterium]MCI0726991.1 hypothetical protein [Chloroflexota bacterium]